jgi:hypothetical protein
VTDLAEPSDVDLTAAPGEGAPYPRPQVRWAVVAGFGAWSTLVWATRIRNIWGDVLLSTDEKAMLTVVALVFVGLGIGVFFVGISLRRWFPQRSDVIAVGVLGGWTLGVWASRVIDIAFGGDHEVPFIVVHVLLAVVSVGLAAWSWSVVAEAREQAPDIPAPGDAAVDASDVGLGSVPVEGQR